MAAIKLPSRDIVNIEPQLPTIAEYEKYLFQDIGGTELINLVRHDTISGINIVYSVISDLTKINIDFDPSLLLINQAKYQSIFNQYAINLNSKIPEEDFYDENDQEPSSNLITNSYFDGDSLVLELIQVSSTEIVEIEVETDGRIDRVRENDYF
jgi:hypothetical protein